MLGTPAKDIPLHDTPNLNMFGARERMAVDAASRPQLYPQNILAAKTDSEVNVFNMERWTYRSTVPQPDAQEKLHRYISHYLYMPVAGLSNLANLGGV